MADPHVLSSTSNPLVKRVRAVAAGREPGLLLEGERLIEDALALEGPFALVAEVVLVDEEQPELAARWEAAGLPVRRAAGHVLERASALKTSPGCLAVFAAPEPRALEELDQLVAAGGLVLVACGVADPGNLGALARAAEAFGAGALVVTGPSAGPHGPRALRGSMGSLLRLPLWQVDDPAALAERLADQGARQARAATRGGRAPSEFDWSGALALWISSETGALPPAAERFEGLTIPMAGAVESLNVAVATAVLLAAAASARGVGR